MTNKQQLERLKEPYRSHAFENCTKEMRGGADKTPEEWLSEESKSLKDTIYGAFIWIKTKQGNKWASIALNSKNYTEK